MSLVLYLLTDSSFLFVFIPQVGAQQEPQTERRTLRMSVVAVNPSAKKTQKVPVKTYLPAEITSQDVLDLGGLNIDFDKSSSTYYLFSDELELQPKETRTFQVEFKDVWIIPKEQLNALRGQPAAIIKRLEGTKDYEAAQKLEAAINKALGTVEQTQNDQAASIKRHIGIYRNNLKIVEQIKENITRLEKQADIAEKTPVPEAESSQEPAIKPSPAELKPTLNPVPQPFSEVPRDDSQ